MTTNERIDQLIEKHRVALQTITKVITHPKTTDKEAETPMACRRFIQGFIHDLEQLKRQTK